MRGRSVRISIVLIYDALYRMGFKADCTGIFYLSYSVYLSVLYPGIRAFSRAWVYPKVGWQYHTHEENICRQVDDAIFQAWSRGKREMEEIAGHPLEKCPNDMEIVWYLYQFVVKTYAL